jgi:nucleoid DNA-binding protein
MCPMKTRDPIPTAAELLEDENSPNVTKRKLVVDITKELSDEAEAQAEQAKETGQSVDVERVPSQLEVLAVIQKTLDHISKAVAENKKVELRNFGVFEVKIRKSRVGRNPNRPEVDVPIPQRAVVKFKPGKEMRESVLRLTPAQPKKK